jgi:TP901 family phage tail tape measure protein
VGVIANLLVKIGADNSNLTSGLSKSASAVTSFGKGVTHVAGITAKAGVAMATAFAGASVAIAAATVGLLKNIAEVGAEFEAKISSIAAVSGQTTKELEPLKKMIMDLGAKTSFSATEVASASEELLKAGLTMEQVMGGGLKGALDLAAAGEISVAEAAEIASTALNAFKKDNLTVSAAADILAGAANASATDISGLRLSLSMVSAVASGMGMNLKDTSTALAVMAQNGLKGSDAGTSLKTMLMNLQPVTDKQTKLFKKLGLLTKEGTSAFYDSKGSMKSLKEISGTLQKSLSGLTDAQRAIALETLFGSDAIRAGNILFTEGAEGIEAMAAAMDKVTAAEVAAKRLDNLKGSLEQLKGSLETVKISLYQNMDAPLRDMTQSLTGFINGLSTSGALDVFSKTISGLFVILQGGDAGQFAGNFAQIVDMIGEGLKTAMPKIQKIAETLIKEYIRGLTTSAPLLITAGMDILQSVIDGITANKDGIDTTLNDIVDKAAKFISKNLGPVVDLGLSILTSIVNGISDNIDTLLPAGIDALNKILESITTNLPKLVPAAVEILKALVKFVAENITELTDCAVEIVTSLVDELCKEDTLKELLSAGWTIVSKLAIAIVNAFPQLVTAGIDIVAALVKELTSDPDAIVKAGFDLGKSIIIGFAQGIIGIHDAIDAAISGKKKPVPTVPITSGAFSGSQLNGAVAPISAAEWAQYGMTGYASGTSYVPRNGLAMLHKGEEVIPAAGARNQAVTVNINGVTDPVMVQGIVAQQFRRAGVFA